MTFVGRVAELDRIKALLAGAPVVITIGGEPGMGKSRLMDEALAAAPTGDVLVAVCSPFPEPYTLAPIVDALSHRVARETVELSPLGGALRTLFPEWAEWLPPALTPSGNPALDRHRLLRAIVELIDALGVHVLALDDAHLADEATLELVQLLFSRSGASAVSVIGTHRTQDVSPEAPLHRLPGQLPSSVRYAPLMLGPLSADETARLAEALLGRAGISPVVAAFVHERTGGLPLAVIELMRYLDEHAEQSPGLAIENLARHSLDQIPLPPTLAASVLDRLGRLPEPAQVCVRAAAVLGEPAPEHDIATVADLALHPARQALAQAMQRGLLREHSDGRISVAHAVIEHVVYDATPAPARRAMHERAAQLLRSGTSTALVRRARHLLRAELQDQWREVAPRAAEAALAAGDDATATTIYFDLVTTDGSTAAEAVEYAGRISYTRLVGLDQYARLIEALRATLATADADAIRAALLLQLGRVFGTIGESQESRRCYVEALPFLREDPAGRARALTMLAWPDASDEPASGHRAWLREAEVYAAQAPAEDQLRLASDRLSVLRLLGDEAGWEVDITASAPFDMTTTRDRAQIAREWLNQGACAIPWGRLGYAAQQLERAREVAERDELPHLLDAITATQRQVDWLTGRWEGLAERVEAFAEAEAISPRQRFAAVLVRGLLEAAATGGLERDCADLTFVAQESLRLSELECLPLAVGTLARLALDDGRPDDALELSRELVTTLARREFWLWLADVGVTHVAALCANDAVGDAAALAEQWAEHTRHLDALSALASVPEAQAYVLARQGDHVRAAALFVQAADVWARQPRPQEEHRARLEAGVCLVSAGDEEEGHALVAEALRALTRLGATGEARRLYRRLERGGISPRTHPWRSGRRSYGAELSPSELDVVRLVATGRSNREIADVLSRSPKTVYVQLRSAMTKLGAETRVDAALKAIDAGLVPHG